MLLKAVPPARLSAEKSTSPQSSVSWPMTPSQRSPMSARMSSTERMVFCSVQISRRQSLSVRRRIHRVPGMDLVLTTRYLPLGFHTSIDIGFAIVQFPFLLLSLGLEREQSSW
uniref:Uncharacterized protein n=1 Tax=Arundo donax TaxID=35708 RepID=A0A0A9E638_ARUDO